jgi:hypothetical protein
VLRVGTPTQSGSPGFGCGESGFGSFRDEFSFTLRYQGQNSHGETVHVGAVATDEIDPGVLETKKELSVSTQTVQFCDHQGSLGPFAFVESRVELGTVVETTAFDL